MDSLGLRPLGSGQHSVSVPLVIHELPVVLLPERAVVGDDLDAEPVAPVLTPLANVDMPWPALILTGTQTVSQSRPKLTRISPTIGDRILAVTVKLLENTAPSVEGSRSAVDAQNKN